jgi:hypothetical protein
MKYLIHLCSFNQYKSLCGDVYQGWGRKRRSTPEGNHLGYILATSSHDVMRRRNKRQSRRNDEDINVGARIDVVDKYSKISEFILISQLSFNRHAISLV